MVRRPEGERRPSRRLADAGWLAFLVGCVLFAGAGIRDGDVWVTSGSILFAAGVVALAAHDRRGP